MQPISKTDLDHILTHADLSALRNQRIFISGGTGFFGCWLLESFLHANRELNLNARATVLTRNPANFTAKVPHLVHDSSITLHAGDVKNYDFPPEKHAFIIHAATDSGGQQANSTPEELRAAIVEGTRHTLRFGAATGARRLLYTSSGAVYGPQPSEITHLPETYAGRASADNIYGSAKLESEDLCLAQPNLESVIARCFAFVGPHLPLDAHFAAGNFIRDAMAGTPLHIKGDGTPHRSYLYAGDLMIWLWTLLLRAPAGSVYNVGSEHSVSIAQLARTTAVTLRPGLEVRIDGVPDPAKPIARYVPSTQKARAELNLRTLIPLEESIRRTAAWHGWSSHSVS
ncbi:MAG: NAD(P)-dependent oxidoreductase [Acidobacteriaceae bacterium]|nr:NAD(P)-dependent oxidoreductase [Acidobacteriaceae bacterium]